MQGSDFNFCQVSENYDERKKSFASNINLSCTLISCYCDEFVFSVLNYNLAGQKSWGTAKRRARHAGNIIKR